MTIKIDGPKVQNLNYNFLRKAKTPTIFFESQEYRRRIQFEHLPVNKYYFTISLAMKV